MFNAQQKQQILNMWDRYRENERSVTKAEMVSFGNTLTPDSPKTGKKITIGTLAQYVFHCLPNALTKYDYMYLFNYILENDSMEEKKKLGFFAQ